MPVQTPLAPHLPYPHPHHPYPTPHHTPCHTTPTHTPLTTFHPSHLAHIPPSPHPPHHFHTFPHLHCPFHHCTFPSPFELLPSCTHEATHTSPSPTIKRHWRSLLPWHGSIPGHTSFKCNFIISLACLGQEGGRRLVLSLFLWDLILSHGAALSMVCAFKQGLLLPGCYSDSGITKLDSYAPPSASLNAPQPRHLARWPLGLPIPTYHATPILPSLGGMPVNLPAGVATWLGRGIWREGAAVRAAGLRITKPVPSSCTNTSACCTCRWRQFGVASPALGPILPARPTYNAAASLHSPPFC